jgi:integrase
MFINSSESDNTRDFYRASLVEFCISKWITDKDVRKFGRVMLSHEEKEDLLDQLAAYIQDPKRSIILADLQNFRSYLNDRKIKGRNVEGRSISPKTKTGLVAGMQAFMSMNEIRFPSKIHRNTFQIKEKDPVDDLPFTVEKAQRVYPHLSQVMKGLFLFMLSTGIRIDVAVNARIDDIDFEKDPVQVRLRAGDAKTRTGGITFLTNECATYLKDYWLVEILIEGKITTVRDVYMQAAGTRGFGLPSKRGKKKFIENDRRIFPMSHSTAYQALRRAIERAGYGETNDKGFLKLHPHSTRKMFRNVVGRYGSPDTAHTIMQHKPGRDAEYLTLSVDQCAADFRKAEPYLTLGISEDAREALATKNVHAAAILDLQTKVAELEALLPVSVEVKARIKKQS